MRGRMRLRLRRLWWNGRGRSRCSRRRRRRCCATKALRCDHRGTCWFRKRLPGATRRRNRNTRLGRRGQRARRYGDGPVPGTGRRKRRMDRATPNGRTNRLKLRRRALRSRSLLFPRNRCCCCGRCGWRCRLLDWMRSLLHCRRRRTRRNRRCHFRRRWRPSLGARSSRFFALYWLLLQFCGGRRSRRRSLRRRCRCLLRSDAGNPITHGIGHILFD